MTYTARFPAGRKPTSPRWERVGLPAVVLVAVGALVAGCSGASSSPGVASLGSSTTTSNGVVSGTGANSSSRESGIPYTNCMRAHGITDFPDPQPGGGWDLQGLDLKSNPEWHSANVACESDLPGGGPSKKTKSRVSIQEELTFAACMRSHGLTGFPDPNSQGVIQITNATGILDPNSPQFEAAENACEPHGSAGVPIAISGNGPSVSVSGNGS